MNAVQRGDITREVAVAPIARVETRARFLVGGLRCTLKCSPEGSDASPSSPSRPLSLNLDAPGLLAALMDGVNSRLARLLPKITRASLQAGAAEPMGSWPVPKCAFLAANADSNAAGVLSALASGWRGVEGQCQNAVAKTIAEEGVRLLWDGQPTAVGGAALGAALPDSVTQPACCTDLATAWQHSGGRRAVLTRLAWRGLGLGLG